MNDETLAIITVASLQADEKLEATGDMTRLTASVRTFLLVYGAQGVIDNGGYKSFFGDNWPGNPPYQDFISAYEAIGCRTQARELRRVVATFPFPNPHLDKDRRRAFMESNYDKTALSVRGWGDALCGDEAVWEKLVRYYQTNEDEFVG